MDKQSYNILRETPIVDAMAQGILKNLSLHYCELGGSQTDMVMDSIKNAIRKTKEELLG